MQFEIVTGQRTGELFRARKVDIDHSGNVPVLMIPRDNTKNGKRADREASALTPHCPYFFASPMQDGPLTPASATRAMGRLRPRLEAADLRVYDLRRTATNGMRRLGVPKFIVSLVVNNVSVTLGDVTAEHYPDEYSFEQDKSEGLLKWGAKIDSLFNKPMGSIALT
jgi:integrase